MNDLSMKTTEHIEFIKYFEGMDDPRQEGKLKYPLDEILLLTLCGVLCGADGCVEISELGEQKLPFLRRFFPFANAIPSDDQLRYIFRHLDPEQFQSCFMRAECSQRPKEPVESSAISVIRSIGLTFS